MKSRAKVISQKHVREIFENAPDVDGCEIKKKTVTSEVYYSDCGELEKSFN